MADWFKFYENDLDETRLQYAISKLPEVVSVWVGILSECCRHKSDTIRWGSNEIELFGFSRRLGVSIPKVNEGINLLVEIEYISKEKDTITVIKWASKQSEYCQKKAKTRESVGTLSGECRPRGEERRGDNKRVRTTFAKPTMPEMELHASKIGLPSTEINRFFNYYEANGWRVGRNPMKSWQSAMVNWRENQNKFTNGKPEKKPIKFGSTIE